MSDHVDERKAGDPMTTQDEWERWWAARVPSRSYTYVAAGGLASVAVWADDEISFWTRRGSAFPTFDYAEALQLADWLRETCRSPTE